MPRITKLIIGAHSILANGGLFALAGTLMACLAARQYAKPIIVVTGQFKFAPVWNLNHEYGAVDFQSPAAMVDRGDIATEGAYWDYVRPELVDVFVTNEGDHSPAYVYRIIKEAYDDEDVDL